MAMNSDVKKVRFFRDGDANFAGVNVAISKAKYRNFDSLLNDLSRKVPLPFGVRKLYTPGGVHHVYNIDELKDGRDYVCSTFNARPIKKLDYVGNSNKPSWRVTKRSFGEATNRNESAESGNKIFHVRNIKPKTITVIAKDDSSIRAKVILNRRTAMTYEGVLQTVSDILQLNSGAVKDLYTLEGKKIGGLSDLINGPDVLLATGRSPGSVSARSLPSRLLKKRSPKKTHSLPMLSKKSSKKDVTQKQKFGNSFNKTSPYTQSKTRAKGKKVKGNPYVFTVKTSDIPDAGTESDVTVVVYGSKGKTGEIVLGPTSTRKFEPGSNEEFEMDVGNIGKIYKMRVVHDEVNDQSGWHLQEIIMTSVARKNEELVFHCDKWFSKSDQESESLRELAATKNGKPLAIVTTYEVSVFTGEVTSAGTDSNVCINIFGENGDTGVRWLKKSWNNGDLFKPGSIDVFEIEAVSLKKLTKILIGHDNGGAVPGWFLDKVLLKDVEEDVEYVCNCRKWLDEDEDDGKTERIIKVSLVSDSVQSSEELWKSNGWKFQDSNKAVLISAENGKVLRMNPTNGKVFTVSDNDDDDDDDDTKENSTFIIKEGGEEKSCILSLKNSQGTFNLTLDNGEITGRKGKPGLLSEFFIEIHQGNLVSLESVVHKGSYVGLSEPGAVVPVAKDSEKRNLFDVKIKGIMRNLGRIRLRPAFHPDYALIESNGHVYGDGDNKDEGAEFVVHKVGKEIRAFQSAITDKFIRVTAQEIDCKGEDNHDEQCQFKIHKDKSSANIQLESIKMPGVFLGVGKHGRIKHAVDAGDEITCLIVEVLSFGSEEITRSSTASNESYNYNDAFDDEAAYVDATSSRGSSAFAVEDKDHDFESDNDSKRSRPTSRDGAEQPNLNRSARSSADSVKSKRGSAGSVRVISRNSISQVEKDTTQTSSAPIVRSSGEKEDNAATVLIKRNDLDVPDGPEDEDTYRTNTPANSVDGHSRPPSSNVRDDLQKALSRIETHEAERARTSSRTSQASPRNPAEHTDEGAVKTEAQNSRSNSSRSNAHSLPQSPDDNDAVDADKEDDTKQLARDELKQHSNANSRASNHSRPTSSNGITRVRVSSAGSRSGNASATKRDIAKEGSKNSQSRPTSRSGSRASGNLRRSSSRNSEIKAGSEEQKSVETSERKETAEDEEGSSRLELDIKNEEKVEKEVDKHSGDVDVEDNDKQKKDAEDTSNLKKASADDDSINTGGNLEGEGKDGGNFEDVKDEKIEERDAEENTEISRSRLATAEDEEKEDGEKPKRSDSDELGNDSNDNQAEENILPDRQIKALSPTPPKTPRSSATVRRRSSPRLSNPADNSRPSSRSPSRQSISDQDKVVEEGDDAGKGESKEDNARDVSREGEEREAEVGDESGNGENGLGNRDEDEATNPTTFEEQDIEKTEINNEDKNEEKKEDKDVHSDIKDSEPSSDIVQKDGEIEQEVENVGMSEDNEKTVTKAVVDDVGEEDKNIVETAENEEKVDASTVIKRDKDEVKIEERSEYTEKQKEDEDSKDINETEDQEESNKKTDGETVVSKDKKDNMSVKEADEVVTDKDIEGENSRENGNDANVSVEKGIKEESDEDKGHNIVDNKEGSVIVAAGEENISEKDNKNDIKEALHDRNEQGGGNEKEIENDEEGREALPEATNGEENDKTVETEEDKVMKETGNKEEDKENFSKVDNPEDANEEENGKKVETEEDENMKETENKEEVKETVAKDDSPEAVSEEENGKKVETEEDEIVKETENKEEDKENVAKDDNPAAVNEEENDKKVETEEDEIVKETENKEEDKENVAKDDNPAAVNEEENDKKVETEEGEIEKETEGRGEEESSDTKDENTDVIYKEENVNDLEAEDKVIRKEDKNKEDRDESSNDVDEKEANEKSENKEDDLKKDVDKEHKEEDNNNNGDNSTETADIGKSREKDTEEKKDSQSVSQNVTQGEEQTTNSNE